jgi:filamentous hemagglutinin
VIKAAENVKDTRMKVLAAGTLALQGASLYNSMLGKDGNVDPEKASSIGVSVSIGSSKSENKLDQTASTTVGSMVAAGNNVNITATTNNIAVTGSNLTAGNNVNLAAAKDISLEAAQGSASQNSTNSSSSSSIGLGISLGAKTGFSVSASVSQARGNSDGNDVINTNAHVDAGNQVNLTSGNDTTLKGAVVTGTQVVANVGNNLNIESLQDTSDYKSQQKSMSAGVTIPIGAGTGSASFSASKSNITSTYASVEEQSGIKTQDGGFQVNVTGNTDLKGGVIASTDAAVTGSKNTFTTAALTTSDIQNRAEYSANAVGVSLGGGPQSGITSAGAGIGSESGNANSVTQSGISGIAGTTSVRANDAQTGINKIFDAQSVQKNIDGQVTITKAFGSAAANAVGTYAGNHQRDLLDQATKESDPVKKQELIDEAQTWSEGGTSRAALHAVVGGLTGNLGGAIGAGAASLSVPVIAEQINNLDVPQPVKNALVLAAGTAVGAVTGGTAGAVTGLNETENNFLKHNQLDQFKNRYAQCKDQSCKDKVLSDMRGLSNAQDALLKQCTTAESCKSLVDGFVYPTEQVGGFAGLFTTEKDTYKFCPSGDQACLGTLKEISSKTNQASLINIAPEYFAANNQLKVTADVFAEDMKKKFGLSDAAALMLVGILSDPTVASGIGSAVGGKKSSNAVEGDGVKGSPASAPVGKSGSPINVTPGTNKPAVINGVAYSGHVLDQMQGRGVPPSAVQNTINTGTVYSTGSGTTGYYDPINNLRVITNSENGRVVTVIPGAPK